MGYGVNLNALCGLTARAAFPGEEPFGTGTNYTDHVMVPTHTLFGIMAALLEREMSGQGQAVAISQLEASLNLVPTDAMAFAANGATLPPLGLADAEGVPHGVYKTLGYRSWIAIAVFSDAEWDSLRKAMGDPQWAMADDFATVEARQRNRARLDAGIEQWASTQYGDWLADSLLRQGVKAGVVKDARQAIEDEHLRRRGFWSYLDHPVVGRTLYNRAPITFSETPVAMKTAAPLIGQHTMSVLTAMLGYSENEVDELTEQGVLV